MRKNQDQRFTQRNLYKRVNLIGGNAKFSVPAQYSAILVDFVDHPNGGEPGCILEIFNDQSKSVDVITVPISKVQAIPQLKYHSKQPMKIKPIRISRRSKPHMMSLG